jgi:hypothetical protein
LTRPFASRRRIDVVTFEHLPFGQPPHVHRRHLPALSESGGR